MTEQSNDPTPSEDVPDEAPDFDQVEEADRQSFPASDPPSTWAGLSSRASLGSARVTG